MDPGWWARVRADIESREYRASHEAGGLQAPNRAHNLRTWFRDDGIVIVPRTTSSTETPEPRGDASRNDGVPRVARLDGRACATEASDASWRCAWRSVAWGRADRMRALEPVAPTATDARVTYERAGLSEWYVNARDGLEQGFTLRDRPAGEGPLRIEGRFEGTLRSVRSSDGASVDLLDAAGACVLRYSGLVAWDARRRELPARIVVEDQAVALMVDDRGAAYPVVVDPLVASPSWVGDGGQVAGSFGFSVATAGDVNHDGFSDVIVGAYAFGAGSFQEGRAFVFHGSALGLSTTPDWTAECNQASAWFGFSVSTAGDVNGDGYDDVIVGSPQEDRSIMVDAGYARVYLGSATGLAATPAWTFNGGQAEAELGQSVSTAGDVNGDGYDDVIVGARLYDGGSSNEGRAYVFLGSAVGLESTASWAAEGNQADAYYGSSVATAGDVNADGYSDVIVGATGYDNGQLSEGQAWVYLGSANGLSPLSAWTADGDQAGALFGESVAGVGDVNGDGYGDVLVGAIFYDWGGFNDGRVFLYLGSATGPGATASWAVSGQDTSQFGRSVATAGDVNGDGYADVIVGAPLHDNGQLMEGRAQVYFGSSAGLSASPNWTEDSNQTQSLLGLSVATAGDVNGDGFSDVIVGASSYDNGTLDEGAAFVYHGGPGDLAAAPAWSKQWNQPGSYLGASVSAAGDLNADGYGDVIVGAWAYDDGQTDEGIAFVYLGTTSGLAASPVWAYGGGQAASFLGLSVGGAGDVNGDGYDDIVVGAPYHDAGQTNEGATFVFHGFSGGVQVSPAWTSHGDQADARFGWSVGGAGDVNGDGYGDVIVGAYGWDGGEVNEGAAFVFHGSPTGLGPTADWSAEPDQAGADFGFSVSTAGDVNRDGWSDVIVGAPDYGSGQASEGAVFVYHGGPGGLAAAAEWSSESNQANASFGLSVATAGDVNGDGFSDVVVGDPTWDGMNADEGRVSVFRGGADGLEPTTSWTRYGLQANARFGDEVSSAGDVNADGRSDLLLAAPYYDSGEVDEGIVYLFLGTAAGPSTSYAWIADGDQIGAHFGAGLAGGLDVNGDGFGDVVVGAPDRDDPEANEGAVFLYYGNEGDGLHVRPKQHQVANPSIPVAFLGRSDATHEVRVQAVARTPAGRAKVTLAMETKPLALAFDGTGVIRFGPIMTGAPVPGQGSVVGLSTIGSGLGPGSPGHWRVRLERRSPFFPRSPWYTLAYNGAGEKDIVTSGSALAAPPEPRSAGLELSAPWPNPFGRETGIEYALPAAAAVRLAVFDAQGRRVATLVDRTETAGHHRVTWDGRADHGPIARAGLYLVRLEVDGEVRSRKVTLVR